MAFDIHEWYRLMTDHNVIFAYKGSITADLISSILETIEAKLTAIDEKLAVRRKVYNVLVEALQNLYHHIDEPPESERNVFDPKFAICIFSKVDDQYKLSTGNFVRKEKIKILKDRMDQINYLTNDEIRSLYKLILNNQEFSEKGGGGLGMVDIAKRTGNKLNYTFYKYDEKIYFFCLDILIV